MNKFFPYRTSAKIPFRGETGEVFFHKRTCLRLGYFAAMSEVERDPETGHLFQPSTHWTVFLHSSGLALCQAYDKWHAIHLLQTFNKLPFPTPFRRISPSEVIFFPEVLKTEFAPNVKLLKQTLKTHGTVYQKGIPVFSSL